MSRFIRETNGWVGYHVSADQERKSRSIREKRDKECDGWNYFEPSDGDCRWVGELGEIVFTNFLETAKVNYDWNQEDAFGREDHTLLGIWSAKKNCYMSLGKRKIDVKTVKRQVPYRSGYTNQVTAKQNHDNVDDFFFMSYQFTNKYMWLIGGISKENFFKHAIFYNEGDWVHQGFRAPQDIYNVDEKHLVSPAEYLKAIARKHNSICEG